MLSQMSDRPLLISQLIDYAADNFGDTEIVSRTVEGPIHRYTYREAQKRSKRLAEALLGLGIKLGDRVATLAWNGYRHFELYYGISGIGAVCHTINPRLAQDHIAYIANHAEDRLLFVDLNLLPIVEAVRSRLTTVEKVVVGTGSFVLGSMLVEQTSNHIEKMTNEFAKPLLEKLSGNNETEQ